jgi:hypothetical protein
LLPVYWYCTMTHTRRAKEIAAKYDFVQWAALVTRSGYSVLAIDPFVQWDPGIHSLVTLVDCQGTGSSYCRVFKQGKRISNYLSWSTANYLTACPGMLCYYALGSTT